MVAEENSGLLWAAMARQWALYGVQFGIILANGLKYGHGFLGEGIGRFNGEILGGRRRSNGALAPRPAWAYPATDYSKFRLFFSHFPAFFPSVRHAASEEKRIRPGGQEAQIVYQLVFPFYDPAGKFIAGDVKRGDNVKKR